MVNISAVFFETLARHFPDLKLKLQQAGIDQKPEQFIKRTVLGAFYLAFGITAFLFLILAKRGIGMTFLLGLFPILIVLFFFYMIKVPDVKINGLQRDLSKEIVFAGRFLVVELESGVPLYNALHNLRKNYPVMGRPIQDIINKVDLGTSMEEAMNESIELVPSEDYRKMMWQIVNSLGTGSEISVSLSAILDQITKKQAIEVSRYGKKLNPLAMFYMMVAVIAPSLGMTMLIILSSFAGFNLSLPILLFIALMIGFVQFMFLSVIKLSRPPIDF